MSDLLEQYVSNLQDLSSESDVRSLYRWFYEKRDSMAVAVEKLNDRLGLSGTKYAFKNELPCIGVGRHDDIVILAANPGWWKRPARKDSGHSANGDSANKPADPCSELVHDVSNPFLSARHCETRWWIRARNLATQLSTTPKPHVGGWELIPFHSVSYKGPSLFADIQIHTMARESISAALRMQPKVLLVASPEGTTLIKSLLSQCNWHSSRKQGRGVPIHYTVFRNTEIIAFEFQLVKTPYSNDRILSTVQKLRAEYKCKSPARSENEKPRGVPQRLQISLPEPSRHLALAKPNRACFQPIQPLLCATRPFLELE